MHQNANQNIHPDVLADLFAGIDLDSIVTAARMVRSTQASDASPPTVTITTVSPDSPPTTTTHQGRVTRVEVDGLEATPEARFQCPNCDYDLALIRVERPDSAETVSSPTTPPRAAATQHGSFPALRTPAPVMRPVASVASSSRNPVPPSPQRTRGRFEWYTVIRGRELGVFRGWDATEPHVAGLDRNGYCRGFNSEVEAYRFFVEQSAAGLTRQVTDST
ncbi:hypothetical protein ONZ45_g7380 [Pleurotus djamor]|nr:hypothetical protein ONZ45_g7380 [Pleurotus djamor]